MGIVPFDYIDKVIEVIQKTPRHTYLILTKRPRRMREYFCEHLKNYEVLPNLWLGVSCENQKRADERILLLLQTPAAKHFVSLEPLLGPINHLQDYFRGFGRFYLSTAIDWIIVGAETGPGARPMDPDWARDIVRQCKSAGVPVFVKQLGKSHRWADPRGADMSKWPKELQVREWPQDHNSF